MKRLTAFASVVTGIMLAGTVFAASAPGVTGLACVNQAGQTFCTYTEPSSDPNWSHYRFDLYESTIGPIIDVTTATLVESGLLDNGGYLDSTLAYTQANRLKSTAMMSTVTSLGVQVAFGTGIAVRTTPVDRTVYYAVITTDRTHLLSDSPVSPGDNSLLAGVTETAGSIQPVLQLASTDPRSKTPIAQRIPANTTGLPMWFYLHGSGGSMPALGDYWALWGDSTMGINDGVQQVARVYYNRSSYGQPVLYAAPQDRVWRDDGLGSIETYWNGFDWQGYVQPYTQQWLNTLLPALVLYYGADPNQIYAQGKSMGALGQTYWGLRQTSQPFAAIYAEGPIWWFEGNVTSMTLHKRIVTTTELIANTSVSYYNDQNSPAWAANCANEMPPIMWASGRLDVTERQYAMWTNSVAAAQAMVACHRGFAFAWNNGNHSTIGPALKPLYTQYQTVYRKNISYPAFTGFSLDADPGDGTVNSKGPVNGSLTGCINCGWSWSVIADTASTWVATVTNSQITSSATADITIRNAQAFLVPPGTPVNWTATGGQSGQVTADQYGLITIPNVSFAVGTTTITASL